MVTPDETGWRVGEGTPERDDATTVLELVPYLIRQANAFPRQVLAQTRPLVTQPDDWRVGRLVAQPSKTVRVGTQRRGEHARVPPVVLRARRRDAITEAVELLRVDPTSGRRSRAPSGFRPPARVASRPLPRDGRLRLPSRATAPSSPFTTALYRCARTLVLRAPSRQLMSVEMHRLPASPALPLRS